MAISMLKIRRPLGRLIFNMGIAIPGKTVFLIETAPWISIMFRPISEYPWIPRVRCVVLKLMLSFPNCNDSSRFYNLLFLTYSYDTHSLQNIQWKVQCIWKSVFRHRELNTQCSTQSHIAIYQDENKSTKSALPHARHYLSRYRIPKCN